MNVNPSYTKQNSYIDQCIFKFLEKMAFETKIIDIDEIAFKEALQKEEDT